MTRLHIIGMSSIQIERRRGPVSRIARVLFACAWPERMLAMKLGQLPRNRDLREFIGILACSWVSMTLLPATKMVRTAAWFFQDKNRFEQGKILGMNTRIVAETTAVPSLADSGGMA